jgi:hypothetical protein
MPPPTMSRLTTMLTSLRVIAGVREKFYSSRTSTLD